jgi:hypothetical protein
MCGLRSTGNVQCGTQIPPLPGRYVQISVLEPNFCGVEVGGGVRCNGELATISLPDAAQ